jgi:hypothetical protein
MDTRSIFSIVIGVLLMAGSAQGCNDKVAPPHPDGAVLGIVTGIEKIADGDGFGWTVYTVRVVEDTAYTDKLSPARRGDAIELRTPGVDGWAEFTFPEGSISTVSMARDETIRTQYRVIDGHRIPTVKYTVWKTGQDWRRGQSAVTATRFEEWLLDSRNAPAYGDSLQLYASGWVPEVFADPVANSPAHPQLNWLTHNGSLLISPAQRVGTLREVRAREAADLDRR